MTQDEIKKLDKKINTIQDPFGKGFPSLRKTFVEMATKNNTTDMQILREYSDWKSSHM